MFKIKDVNMEHIKEIMQDGYPIIDLIILKDGRVLGVDDDSIVLYNSLDDFYSMESKDRQIIKLHYKEIKNG